MKGAVTVRISAAKESPTNMRFRMALIPVLLSLSACAGLPESTGTVTFINSSSDVVRIVKINVGKSSARTEFQTEKRSPHDQLLSIRDVKPGGRQTLEYTSLSEQIIDIRVTWENGRSERFYVGYKPDMFTGRHTLEATDHTLLFDGVTKGPADEGPAARDSATSAL